MKISYSNESVYDQTATWLILPYDAFFVFLNQKTVLFR